VPATEATFADGGLRLPVTVDAVKSAPHLEGDHLSPDEEARLRRHYGLESLPAGTTTWEATGDGLRPPGAGDEVATGPETTTMDAPLPPPPASYGTVEPSDGGMVRSEERLRVGTERVAATRVRLVKYVVTEEVQITVPIRREEIRIEEVPVDAADDGDPGESLVSGESLGSGEDAYGAHSARAGSEMTGGLPDEVILHTERPVVSVEVVPRERVRLRTELVQGQETVTGQVQREEIVVDETPSPGVSPR
jgi:stress response protein YsnF